MRVREALGLMEVHGQVGIEIEAEGRNMCMVQETELWRSERDGSLRGDSAEFVLKEPIALADVPKAMHELKDGLLAANARHEESQRAGVHVHVNVQELTRVQLLSFIVLYLIFEDVLTEWCGPDRVGNLFCLRASDAEALIDGLREKARAPFKQWGDDTYRYAAMNITAVQRYGSLEFRAMRSTMSVNTMMQWTDMLWRLREAGMQYDNPHEIIEEISVRTPEVLFEDIFGRGTALRFDYNSVMDGVRRAQHLAYNLELYEDRAKPKQTKSFWYDRMGTFVPYEYPHHERIIKLHHEGGSYMEYAKHFTHWVVENYPGSIYFDEAEAAHVDSVTLEDLIHGAGDEGEWL